VRLGTSPRVAVRATALALVLLSPVAAARYSAAARSGNVHPARIDVGPALDPLIARTAPIIIGPDRSPVVALYHAHRRGWTFPRIATAETLPELVARGARFLVSADRDFESAPGVARHLGPRVALIGSVRVYLLVAGAAEPPPRAPGTGPLSEPPR
jgi:hypothetical protein